MLSISVDETEAPRDMATIVFDNPKALTGLVTAGADAVAAAEGRAGRYEYQWVAITK